MAVLFDGDLGPSYTGGRGNDGLLNMLVALKFPISVGRVVKPRSLKTMVSGSSSQSTSAQSLERC